MMKQHGTYRPGANVCQPKKKDEKEYADKFDEMVKKRKKVETGYLTDEMVDELIEGLDKLTPEDYDDVFKDLKLKEENA